MNTAATVGQRAERIAVRMAERIARAAMQFPPAAAFLDRVMDSAGYDIAKRGRLTADWVGATPTSANTEIAEASPIARDRAHDLVRNNPTAKRAKQVLQSRLVGGGLTPIARKEWMALWRRWSPHCYIANRSNIERLQTMLVGACVEAGEVYGWRRWCDRRTLGWDGRPLPVPLQIQILEADQVDDTKDGPLPDGGMDVNGIRFGADGRPVSVWFFLTPPGDRWATSTESVEVPYADLFHLYDEERPGQAHGMTWFAAAGAQMRRLQRYEDYELTRKQNESLTVAVVETSETAADPPDLTDPKLSEAERIALRAVRDNAGKIVGTWSPGQVLMPPPGRKVVPYTPAPTQGYNEFVTKHDHRTAMGMGVPHYSLSGDLRDVNFSSARIGDVDTRQWTVPWQEQVLAPLAMDVIALWFTEAAVASGKLRGKVEDWYPIIGWQPGAIEEHDRKAAAEADGLELRYCLTSLRERLQARHSRDPDTVLQEIEDERKDLAKRGIVSDGNGNDTTNQGQPRYTQNAGSTASGAGASH